MPKPVFNEVREFLESSPPSVQHGSCELCEGTWLITISNIDRYGLPTRFVMCRQCGLVSQSPRWGREEYLTFYSRHYRRLVTEWSGRATDAKTGDSSVRMFKAMAGSTGLSKVLPPTPRTLDIGGSDGALGAFLRDEFGADVTVVEPNSVEAGIAESRGLHVIEDVFEEADLIESSFDFIVMMRTVDHIIDAKATFSKIRRLLKPGGHVMIDGIDYFRRMAFTQDPVWPLKVDHCYYFSPESMPLLMEKCGLRSVALDLDIYPGSIVNLARAGDPKDVTVKGLECLPGAEARFAEWEGFANRPKFAAKSGYFTRTLVREAGWVKDRLVKKVRRKK